MVYSHYGLLLSNEKEQSIDIRNHIDESQKYYGKQKKTYMTCPHIHTKL